MKTAILINGFIRTWENCKQSFKDTFSHLNADIFLSTYDMKYGYAPYIKGLINFHEDEKITMEQIYEMFKDLNMIACNYSETDKMDEVMEQMKPYIRIDYHNIHTFLAQTIKINNGMDMIRLNEEASGFKYDQIIKTRCDLIYHKFDPVVAPGQVLIDAGSTFPNDCFYMARRDEMFAIQEFMIEEYFKPKYLAESSSWPPHSILHSAFKHNKLEIKTDRIMDYVERVNLKQKY